MDRKSLLRLLRGERETSQVHTDIGEPVPAADHVLVVPDPPLRGPIHYPSSTLTTVDVNPCAFSADLCYNSSTLPRGVWRSNTEDMWHHPDVEELYKVNAKKHHEVMRYSDKDIVYKLNSKGYRSPEPFTANQEPSVVYLGCSFTFGSGLPLHETWPVLLHSKIETELGRELGYHNLGACGSSNDLIARRAVSSGLLNPVLIVVLYSFICRREYVNFSDGLYESAHSGHCQQAISILEQGDFNNDAYNFIKNQSFVEMAARLMQCPLVSTCLDELVVPGSGFKESPDFFMRGSDRTRYSALARDLQHPGREYHEQLAEDFYSRMLDRSMFKEMANRLSQ